jgi:hypothetical protein
MHAVLAMVRAPESDAQSAIFALLQSNGWREPEIKNLKLVESWCIQIQSMKPNALLRSN